MLSLRYFFSLSLLALLMSSFITKSTREPDVYKFNTSQSSITWTSNAEDGTKHTGQLKFKSGTLKIDVKTLLGGFSYINMQSLSCTDIKDEGFNREYIVEMRSAEQLDVVKYKKATLKVVKAKRLDVPEGQPNYDIDAVVTLKGIKTNVNFKATIVLKKGKLTMDAKFTLPGDKTSIPYDMDWVLKIVANKA